MLSHFERDEIARQIREYRRLSDAWDTVVSSAAPGAEVDSDQADDVWDAKEQLRGHLFDKPPIVCDGRLYVNGYGDLIVLDTKTFVDVSTEPMPTESRPASETTLTIPGWIPVGERLPEIDPETGVGRAGYSEYVIVWPYSQMDPERMMAVYCEPRSRFETGAGEPLPEVTHWMPLPNPPKETP